MTELERIEEQISELDKRQTSFEVRFDMYMRKTDELIRLQREDMKEFKVRHEADMARIDAKFDKMDAKMDKLADKIDGLVKYVQSMAVTSMIGMLGIVGSVVYFVYSVTPKP